MRAFTSEIKVNKGGFGLVELMVAASITGILALALTNLMRNMQTGTHEIESRVAASDIHRELLTRKFVNRDDCALTLGQAGISNSNPDAGDTSLLSGGMRSITHNGVFQYAGANLGLTDTFIDLGNIRIEDIQIGLYDPSSLTAQILVTYSYGVGGGERRETYRSSTLQLTESGGSFIDCAWASEGATGPWVTTSDGIHYDVPNRQVAIGMEAQDENAALRVLGAAIFGNRHNIAHGNNSFVTGGMADGDEDWQRNRALGEYSAVVGGRGNLAWDFSTFVGGGASNEARGEWSAVVGGQHNQAHDDYSFIGGGEGNNAWGNRSAVIGGRENEADDTDAFVGGGQFNQASGRQSFVGGGRYNIAGGRTSVVLGGQGGHASHDGSIILLDNESDNIDGTTPQVMSNSINSFTAKFENGHRLCTNVDCDNGLRIVGGTGTAAGNIAIGYHSNVASGANAFVSGGAAPSGMTPNHNTASGSSSFIGGGTRNTASAARSVLMGGQENRATGVQSGVFGGENNHASHQGSFVIGGQNSVAASLYAGVVGGYSNRSESLAGVVAAGFNNSLGVGAGNAAHSFMAGGAGNQLQAGLNSSIIAGVGNSINIPAGMDGRSVIIGGSSNQVTRGFSVVAGGFANHATAERAGVIAGRENRAQASNSVVVGGFNNRTASDAERSVAVGGSSNTVNNSNSVILGGHSNEINSVNSAILMGTENRIGTNAFVSMALGYRSQVRNNDPGSIVMSDNTTAETITSRGSQTFTAKYRNGFRFCLQNPGTDQSCGGGGAGLAIRTNGNIDQGGGSLVNASDERLKTDISLIEDATDKILALGGYQYRWKESGQQAFGIIAQEALKSFPEIVFEDEDDGYLRVNYSALSPLLIQGFKEQQEQIEKNRKLFVMMQRGIERRVANLEKEVSDLRRENRELRGMIEDLYQRLERLESAQDN